MSCLFYHLSVRSGSRILFQNFSCPRFHFLLGFPWLQSGAAVL